MLSSHMARHCTLICLSSLGFLLLSSPVPAISSPLPTVNGSSSYGSGSNSVKMRAVPQLNADGWIPFDSVGMMLPVKLNDDYSSHTSECATVECKQHMDYASTSNGASLPPGLGLFRRDLPRQGSRDIARRKAQIGFDDITGQPTYNLADYGDEDGEAQESSDDNDGGVEEDYTSDEEEADDGNEEFESSDEDEDDESDREALAKRHLPLVRGVSVLGTPTFSRRDEGILSRLFRRKKPNSKKVDLDDLKKKRRKNKSNLKGKNTKSKAIKKVTKKGKGNLKLGGIDLMKGATILTTITWYTGIDLLNPYCDRKTKWTPTDDSMIIAVTEKWSLRPACGEFMEITTQDDKEPRSIIARVVDLCGGCIPEVPHADLSKAAFSKLYDLDVGRVRGLKMRRVGAPKRWSNKLYGPKVL